MEEEYKEYHIPKSYGIPLKISNGILGNNEIESLHKNGANDVYKSKSPKGIIIVNKKSQKYDQIEFYGNVKENKLKLESIIGEKI